MPTTYNSDSRGNRTVTRPTGVRDKPPCRITTFGYDQANRLSAHGTTATYAYNGDGLRMSEPPRV